MNTLLWTDEQVSSFEEILLDSLRTIGRVKSKGRLKAIKVTDNGWVVFGNPINYSIMLPPPK